MARNFPEQRDPNVANTGSAAEGELIDADQPLLENAERELGGDPADREPGTLADDDALAMDVASQPMSEITGANDASGSTETADGLDEIGESVRRETEDRATGGWPGRPGLVGRRPSGWQGAGFQGRGARSRPTRRR